MSNYSTDCIAKKANNREKFIEYLRCLAALLIINSHYGPFYPQKLSFLAFGGLIGNCLFMLISGYCLYGIKFNFISWYKKRILRIYISYLLVAVPSFIAAKDFSLQSFFEFVYPIRHYHFIASIMIVYIVYYVIQYMHLKIRMRYSIVIPVLFVLQVLSFFLLINYKDYHLSDHFNLFEIVSYIIVMLFGALIRENKNNLNRIKKKWSVSIFIVVFGLDIVISKMLSFNGDKLIIWILSIMICLIVATIFIGLDEKLKSIKVVEMIASITLELYLVQMFIIRNCIDNLRFPEGLFLGSIMIFGSAYMIKCISNNILNSLGKSTILSGEKVISKQ